MNDKQIEYQFAKLNSKVEKILARQNVEWLNEEEAAKLLDISVRTLQNKVSLMEIPRKYYRVGVTGKRFYNKEKLLGK